MEVFLTITLGWFVIAFPLSVLFGKMIASGSQTAPGAEPAPLQVGRRNELGSATGHGSMDVTRYAGCAILEVLESCELHAVPVVALLPSVIGYADGTVESGTDVDIHQVYYTGQGSDRVTALLRDAERAGERVDVCIEIMRAADRTPVARAVTVTVCGEPSRRASMIETEADNSRL